MARGAGKLGLVVSVLVLFVSGCTAEQTKPAELSNEPSTSASPSIASDEQAVTDVYKKFFETLQALGSADDATIRAKLSPYATDSAVERIVAALARFRSLNQQPAGYVVFAELETAISGNWATVRECHDGTTELIVDSTTGAVISTGPISGQQANLARDGGTWRMVSHDDAADAC